MSANKHRRGRKAPGVTPDADQMGLWALPANPETGNPWGVSRAERARMLPPGHAAFGPERAAPQPKPRVPDNMRRCPRCKVVRPFDEFTTSTGGRECYCRDCRRARRRHNYMERERNPLAAYGKHLRRVYGITLAQYQALYDAQGGVCAICGEPETWRGTGKGTSKRYGHLAVDHDHRTGEVRALLCGRCNTGIGSFRDQPNLLVLAAQYLASRKRVA